MCGSEGVVVFFGVFFGRKLGWTGRGYILPMLCKAKTFFFFRFCREYPQMDLGEL